MPIQTQSHEIELALQNTTERVEIAIYDQNGRPIDPVYLRLNVMDNRDGILFSDTLYAAPGNVVQPLPSRITRVARGKYFFPFGADNANGVPAVFYSRLAVPPAPPWDVSVNNKLSLALDGKAPLIITLTSATPTQASPQDIVGAINGTLYNSPVYGQPYGQVARYYLGQVFLASPQVTYTAQSSITIDNTIVNSAVNTLFGLQPAIVLNVAGNSQLTASAAALMLTNRTMTPGDFLFQWQATAAKGLGSTSILQVVKVATPRAFAILPYFRTEVDKALKQIGNDLARTGYTDAQLMGYLTLGVSEINAYQPITNFTIDTFPSRDFMMILIWTAMLVALVSQGLFAIDTDIDYNDRGANFRLDHAGKIQPYISTIISRLEQRMTPFKQLFASVGTVKIEAGANERLATILSAAPTGSLLRGMFIGGP